MGPSATPKPPQHGQIRGVMFQLLQACIVVLEGFILVLLGCYEYGAEYAGVLRQKVGF